MAWPAGSGRKFWIVSRSYLGASILMIGKKNAASSTFSRRRVQSRGSPAGFYKRTKGGRLCVLDVRRSLKGVDQAVWLEKPKVRVKVETRAI
jgi:hypothetical protein